MSLIHDSAAAGGKKTFKKIFSISGVAALKKRMVPRRDTWWRGIEPFGMLSCCWCGV